jgi:hypothetical protein
MITNRLLIFEKKNYEISMGWRCKTSGIADIWFLPYNFIIINLATDGWSAGDGHTKGTRILIGSLHVHAQARDDRPDALSFTHNTYIIIHNSYQCTRSVKYF